MSYRNTEKQNAWNRAYYQRNLQQQRLRLLEKQKKARAQIKTYLDGYLASHPCVDCGESDPIVLEFDHRDPKLKRFNIAVARKGKFTLGRVIEEVAKCDIRCANCHRRSTALQVKMGVFRPGYPVRARQASELETAQISFLGNVGA